MSIDTRLSSELQKQLKELRDRAISTIVDPKQITSFDLYRHSTGYVQALDHVDQMMEQILTEIQEN